MESAPDWPPQAGAYGAGVGPPGPGELREGVVTGACLCHWFTVNTRGLP